MKLHIGCGKIYKKDYINIDVFDSTVADRIMPAHKLDFEENSVNEINCEHTLEHLGIAKSIYALSEFYRVLKPSGTLVLEVPNIETSFSNFLKFKDEKRKFLMNWIFGLDSPGMGHKYGYPRNLLLKLLEETGFEDFKVILFGNDTIQPVMRVKCVKPKSVTYHSLISSLRQDLIATNSVNLEDQVVTLDYEDVIRRLSIQTSHLINHYSDQQLSVTVEGILVQSPKIAKSYLMMVDKTTEIPKETFELLKDVVEAFELLNFPEILVHLFKQMPLDSGTQAELYSDTISLGCTSIQKAMNLQHQSSVLTQLESTLKSIRQLEDVDFFSEQTLKTLAAKWFSLGCKAYAQSEYEKAYTFLMNSFRLNRDDILITWNLARISTIRGAIKESEKFYGLTYLLAGRYYLTHQKAIKKRIHDATDLSSPKYKILG